MLHYVLSLMLFVIGLCESKSIVDSNDTALEYLNNCKCVLDSQCYNGVLNIHGIGIITIRNNADNKTTPIQCSKPSYICCREDHKDQLVIRNDISLFVSGPVTNLPPDTSQNYTQKRRKVTNKCGKQKALINIRILSDSDDITSSIDGEFPWMTAIYKKNQLDDTFQFKCAGSLISDVVVLTAAHCVHGARRKPSEFKILANGRKELLKIGDDPDQERDVEKIIVHPEYYAGGAHNDLALMVLKKSYNESHQLNNVCLPHLDVDFDTARCLATGWGVGKGEILTDEKILRKVELPIVDRGKCEEQLRKTRLGTEFQLHESFICAGGEKGKDTCKGDGGGPLICPVDEGRFVQVGIVSWGVDCAKEGHPGVYTDVRKFSNWIQKNIDGNAVPS